MTALSESFCLTSIHIVFSWPISTLLLFSQIRKPILDTLLPYVPPTIVHSTAPLLTPSPHRYVPSSFHCPHSCIPSPNHMPHPPPCVLPLVHTLPPSFVAAHILLVPPLLPFMAMHTTAWTLATAGRAGIFIQARLCL